MALAAGLVAVMLGVAACGTSSSSTDAGKGSGDKAALTLLDNGPARLLVRPEQIQLAGSSQVGVEARVADVSYFGHDAAVHLQVLASGRLVTARVLGLLVPMPDTVVRLSVTGSVAAYSSEV